MPPRIRAAHGFTLVEAVIVIAIMAILASAATPMLMRALNQQRARQTRDLVRAGYEAMVGARDRSVPNLMTDVGFVPPAALADLRFLTTINPAVAYRNGAVPPQYPIASIPAGFNWGWNGPYWTGPVQSQAGTNGIPADGWGNPLRWQNNQVQSAGPDGQFNPPRATDNLVYPPPPAAAPASAQLFVSVQRQLPPPWTPPPPLPAAATFTMLVTDRNQQQIRTRPTNPPTYNFAGSNSQTTAPLVVAPGVVLITVTSAVAGNQSEIVVLAPGETRVVLFRTNL